MSERNALRQYSDLVSQRLSKSQPTVHVGRGKRTRSSLFRRVRRSVKVSGCSPACNARGHLKRAAGVLERTEPRYRFPTVAPLVQIRRSAALANQGILPWGGRVSLDSPMRLILRTRGRSGLGRNTSKGSDTAGRIANCMLARTREDARGLEMGSSHAGIDKDHAGA